MKTKQKKMKNMPIRILNGTTSKLLFHTVFASVKKNAPL